MKYPDRIKNRFQSAWIWFLDLDVLEWALPIILAITALGFELAGHRQMKELMEPNHFSEIIIFGTVGPIIIHRLLVWMHGLMNAQKQATAEIVALNRELENKVNERTVALAQRNTELARANIELKQLDQMKSEFVSLVSHELRAPLTTLNGGLELALQQAEALPAPARRTLETMAGESNRLTQLVQTILDVSRLEAGKLEINLGPVALRPLMEQAAEVVLIPKNRPLEWKFTPDLPPVWADEVHLEEIVRNLMRNADKYSPPGAPIYLCACEEEERVRISVKDHGPGIPQESQQYIFERFSRVHSGENAPPGWGLGLYFARKLAQAQNSAIGVKSPIWEKPNSPGAEFFLLVPVAISSEE
jgi:signal transduction histidine kinase